MSGVHLTAVARLVPVLAAGRPMAKAPEPTGQKPRTRAASPADAHLNGVAHENGDRNGRRKRQTPVTITDPASAGTDASEEHVTQ